METKEKLSEQTDVATSTPVPQQSARGPLGKLMLTTFIGYAFMYLVTFFYILLVAKIFIPPILIEVALVVLATGVVATGWRWAPHLGALIALLTLYDPIFQPHNIYTFLHPGQSNFEFILIILVIAFGFVSLVTCVGAIVQTHWRKSQEPRLPRFSGFLLSGFAGLVLGLIVLSLVVTIVPQTSAASTSANGQTVVHMTAENFAQNVVLVPKGGSLKVVNDSSEEHLLRNGSWDTSGTAHPATEVGAPTLHNVDITNGSAEIGPFPTAGVYHIYCTVHPGMNLTIVVQ